MKPKPPKSKALRNLTHDSMPASVGLVKEVREELRAEIRSTKLDLESKIENVLIVSHRTQVLMEEQRSENRVVLDGLKTVLDGQARLEADFANLRRSVVHPTPPA